MLAAAVTIWLVLLLLTMSLFAVVVSLQALVRGVRTATRAVQPSHEHLAEAGRGGAVQAA